jgi:hypothetical protein
MFVNGVAFFPSAGKINHVVEFRNVRLLLGLSEQMPIITISDGYCKMRISKTSWTGR